MILYLLSHSREVEKDVVSTAIIGIYSSANIVKQTISKYRSIAGFDMYPNGFMIDEYDVCTSQSVNSIKSVYLLQHEYTEDEYDYITTIGIYLNYKNAQDTVKKLSNEPKYQHYLGGLYPPNGFNIDEYIINASHWSEGFVTY